MIKHNGDTTDTCLGPKAGGFGKGGASRWETNFSSQFGFSGKKKQGGNPFGSVQDRDIFSEPVVGKPFFSDYAFYVFFGISLPIAVGKPVYGKIRQGWGLRHFWRTCRGETVIVLTTHLVFFCVLLPTAGGKPVYGTHSVGLG